jgi:hypothetical protein
VSGSGELDVVVAALGKNGPLIWTSTTTEAHRANLLFLFLLRVTAIGQLTPREVF